MRSMRTVLSSRSPETALHVNRDMRGWRLGERPDLLFDNGNNNNNNSDEE